MAACAAILGGLAGAARAQDDIVLFSTAVTPNVLLVIDNGGSMNEIVWHPDFDPTVTPTCAAFANANTYSYSSNTTLTLCGRTRTIFHDTKINPLSTRYSGLYLNWLFSPAADAAYTEIAQGNNAFPSSCVGGAAFGKYQRTRITAAKQVVKDIVCEVNLVSSVRFGLATFREAADPNGGYVLCPVEEYSSTQAADFDSQLQSIDADTQTPLGEALFQAYTYYMSRVDADRPVGVDGVTKFPKYSYRTNNSGGGGSYSTSGPPQVPGSPVQYSCQKHFIVVVTDGAPTYDDFSVALPTNTAAGFTSFSSLIGDYNADGETEVQSNLYCPGCKTAFYMDDVAKYMQEHDFRPDFNGEQVIDTYTVGFMTGDAENGLLAKTAAVGNGLFFASRNAEELAQALISALVDIIEKSQSFTAATVPAARTRDGGGFYTTLFVPSGKSSFWEGHLYRYKITGTGEIHDANGNCAVADPTGECKSGPFLPGAVPYWDAGSEVPSPDARDLYTSRLAAGTASRVPFDITLSAADLSISVFPPATGYVGSSALNVEGFADEIIQSIRGCAFGTGVSSSDVATPGTCAERPWLLGDIFHSNPVVVGQPSTPLQESSHADFRATYAQRDRVIYAGGNDGFLHGLHAGDWDASADPAAHDPGTGEELFGFMPWLSRQTIQYKPNDIGSRDYYYVDGSPAVADVWIHSSATDTSKTGDEWRTMLAGGLRQGGGQYYALDVTDPASGSYPGYAWEFPREDAPAALMNTMGDTWGEPVFTRVKVRVGTDDNGGAGYERAVVVVSAGYHETSDPNHLSYDPTSPRGRALYMIDAKTGEILATKVFGLGVGQVPTMRYAMTATPAVFDLDFDGFADVIYAADLGGNVWKWVVKAIGEDPVTSGGSTTQPTWPFRRFFAAPVATASGVSYYKSFFYPPAATFIDNRLWLLIGSGERVNLNFEGLAGQDENNRVYAITDPDPTDSAAPVYPLLTEMGLTDYTNATGCTTPSSRGYFLKAADGEKFVTNSEIFAGYAVLASFLPNPSADPCLIGGDSNLYVFRLKCGEGFFTDASGDPARVLDLGAGMPTDPRLTVGSESGTNRLIVNKQEGEIINLEAPDIESGNLGVLYWRELTQ